MDIFRSGDGAEPQRLKGRWRKMAGKSTGKIMGIVLISVVLIVVTAGCTGQNRNNRRRNHPGENANLSPSDLRTLMKQVAKNETEIRYAGYVPDKAFADAKVFGIDRDGGKGAAYVYLEVAEYAAVKGKAYHLSGLPERPSFGSDIRRAGRSLQKLSGAPTVTCMIVGLKSTSRKRVRESAISLSFLRCCSKAGGWAGSKKISERKSKKTWAFPWKRRIFLILTQIKGPMKSSGR